MKEGEMAIKTDFILSRCIYGTNVFMLESP